MEWRLLETPLTSLEEHVDKQAMEVVRGYYYDNPKHEKPYQILMLGYLVIEPMDISSPMLGVDGYSIQLDTPDQYRDEIKHKTLHHTLDWSGNIVLKHVASKQELRQLLMDFFEEIEIVGILADMLHYFKRPTKTRTNEWRDDKLRTMDSCMRPLFQELEYNTLEKSQITPE